MSPKASVHGLCACAGVCACVSLSTCVHVCMHVWAYVSVFSGFRLFQQAGTGPPRLQQSSSASHSGGAVDMCAAREVGWLRVAGEKKARQRVVSEGPAQALWMCVSLLGWGRPSSGPRHSEAPLNTVLRTNRLTHRCPQGTVHSWDATLRSGLQGPWPARRLGQARNGRRMARSCLWGRLSAQAGLAHTVSALWHPLPPSYRAHKPTT